MRRHSLGRSLHSRLSECAMHERVRNYASLVFGAYVIAAQLCPCDEWTGVRRARVRHLSRTRKAYESRAPSTAVTVN